MARARSRARTKWRGLASLPTAPSVLSVGRTPPPAPARRGLGRALRGVRTTRSPEADAYIAHAPRGLEGRPRQARRILRAVLPGATKVTSCPSPGLRYPGHRHKGMCGSVLRPDIPGCFCVRPPWRTIDTRSRATGRPRSALHLPLTGPHPVARNQRSVWASLRIMLERDRAKRAQDRERSIVRRGRRALSPGWTGIEKRAGWTEGAGGWPGPYPVSGPEVVGKGKGCAMGRVSTRRPFRPS